MEISTKKLNERWENVYDCLSKFETENTMKFSFRRKITPMIFVNLNFGVLHVLEK